MRAELEKQAADLEELKKDMEGKKMGHSKQFETLDDLMKPYKKHLLQSAFDLQSRLYGQVNPSSMCLQSPPCGHVVRACHA